MKRDRTSHPAFRALVLGPRTVSLKYCAEAKVYPTPTLPLSGSCQSLPKGPRTLMSLRNKIGGTLGTWCEIPATRVLYWASLIESEAETSSQRTGLLTTEATMPRRLLAFCDSRPPLLATNTSSFPTRVSNTAKVEVKISLGSCARM